MDIFVKMTDKEYEEYKEYIKNKEEYVKKSEVPLNDIIKRNYNYVGSNYDSVFDAQVVSFKHKTRNMEIFVRDFDYNKRS